MLTLLVLQGPDKGRRFELPDNPALIGRDSRQLPLTDNTVSRRHAELLPEGGGSHWILRDMGSANGSYINGTRVADRHALVLGDQIRVGRTVMVFGAQPGVSRSSGRSVALSGDEEGMDISIMQTITSNDDSMVLAVPEPAAVAMANLKILYRLGAALGSSFGIDQVLDVVMDLTFEHVQAERGIALLVDPRTGQLVPKVVRTRKTSEENGKPIDEKAVNPEQIHASRTIIDHVMKSGQGVLSSNAMTDKRFAKGHSVHSMGIRSAMCVPIKALKLAAKETEEIIGVIYIDSSVKNYTYSTDQLRLLAAIGLQAGMAITNAKLYQSGVATERLAAIGETTAALSHSIKNILQALRGGADVVQMGLKAGNVPQATKGWRIVDRNLEQIYNLTMNLLAYSRPREPRIEHIQPKKLIEESLELVAAGANEKGVMAVADIEADHPPIPADPDGLHQVLMNLLSNALDAVEPKRGLIRVVCRFDSDNRRSTIEVIDNGVGIPPNMMKHMFELFHSTKGNRGTGIGLAVAKKIVDEHDGSITVKSEVGKGTTFTIRLPVYSATVSDPSHTHGPAR